MREEQAVEAYLKDPSRERLLAVLRAHQDRVYNVCFQVLRHAHDAEDAAQKALLKLAEGAKALPDPAALRRWVYRVAMTTALDLREERSRRQAHERRAALVKKPESQPASDDDGLYGAIASLEPELGELILRHYFEKATLKALAHEQRCSEVAVWKRIEKGRERLREILTASGSGLSVAALAARLDAIVPVQAPALLLSKTATAAGLVWGGFAVAAKTGMNAKIIAAGLAVLAAGVGGGILFGTARSRPEQPASETRAPQASARHASERPPAPLPRQAAPAPVAPAPEKAPPPAAERPSSSLRDRVRRLVRLSLRAHAEGREAGLESDPEVVKEIAALMAEIGPMITSPSERPDAYVEFVKSSLEVMLEEMGSPLTEGQLRALTASADRMLAILKEAPQDPPRDRPLAELKANREFLRGLSSLSAEQLAAWSSKAKVGSGLLPGGESEKAFAPRGERAAEGIVQVWTRKYGLEDPQKGSAATAARVFAEAWTRIDQEFEARSGTRLQGWPPGPLPGNVVEQARLLIDYQIATLEAQREALSVLEASMVPAQQEKLKRTPMVQYYRAPAPR